METITEETEAVAMRSKAQELFKLCDQDDKGFVTCDDLKNIQVDLDLSTEQIEVVFSQLDKNSDGYLTAEEFESGLELFFAASLHSPTKKEFNTDEDIESKDVSSSDVGSNVELLENISSEEYLDCNSKYKTEPDTEEYAEIRSRSEICNSCQPTGFLEGIVNIELLSQIENQYPELQPLFEDFLRNVYEQHEQIMNETAILKESFNKKTTEYEHQIHVLYEEMESQIKEEREAILSQKLEIESQLRQELDDTVDMKEQDVQELLTKWLQASTQLKELSETKTATENENQQLLKDKEQLEYQLDYYKQNLQEVHDKMNEFKASSATEKRDHFWSALQLSEKIVCEREALVKQLHFLRSINRRLQDENDEMGDNVPRMDTTEQLPHRVLSKRGSLMSDYFDSEKSQPASTPGNKDDASSFVPSKENIFPSTPPVCSNPFMKDIFTPSAEGIWPYAATNPFLDDIKKIGHKEKSSTYTSFSDPDLDYFEDFAKPCENAQDLSTERKTPALCLIHPNNHQMNGLPIDSEPKRHLGEEKITEDINANIEAVAMNSAPMKASTSIGNLSPGQTPESLFKIVFIGDSGVGKTSLINRICGGVFQEKFSATIGVDFKVRNVIIDGHPIALQLWDTAGQERFRSITTQYLRKSDGVLIAYDATSELSFKNISSWISSIDNVQNENVVVALLGNKSDLAATNKVISAEIGKQLAEDRDALFFETSAKDGTGIEELVLAMGRKLQTQQVRELERCVELAKPAMVASKKTCC